MTTRRAMRAAECNHCRRMTTRFERCGEMRVVTPCCGADICIVKVHETAAAVDRDDLNTPYEDAL